MAGVGHKVILAEVVFLQGIDVEDLLAPDMKTVLMIHPCHTEEGPDDVDMSMNC